MRTWLIIVIALLAAAAVDAAWLGSAGAAAGVWPRLPVLALAALALYALVALALVTGTIALDAARVRRRLSGLEAPSRRDWTAAFAGTALVRMTPRLLDLAPLDGRRGGLLVQSRFDIASARREIGQLHSLRLASAQFATALFLLLALAALGFVRAFSGPAIVPAGIPAAPALAAAVILAGLGLLGRIIAVAAAEPLLETVGALPVERLDLALLRHLAEFLQPGAAAPAGGPAAQLSAALGRLLERLVEAIAEGRVALIEAMASLSAQAEALAMALRAVAERGPPERGEERPELAEFHAAVLQMRELMEELATAQQAPAGSAREAAAGGRETAEAGLSRAELSREVRDLLANLE